MPDLEIGQILKVPYVPKRQVRSTDGTIHTVASKETMFSISQAYNVTIDEIKQWNNLTDNSLSVGQEIIIKKGSSRANTTVATGATNTKGFISSQQKRRCFLSPNNMASRCNS